MKVIVNADDYGHDENRTRAIQEAFRLGAITATTAMANRPWFERAMKKAKELGFIADVGLHFNISEGEPLSEEMRNCRFLVDANGCFVARFHNTLSGRLYLPPDARRAIRVEAEAQIRKYLDCGGVLMHLDSHHHVHTDFSVSRELYPIAKKYGFKSARLSRNFGGSMNLAKRIYKFFWNSSAGKTIPFRVQYFCSFGDFSAMWKNLSRDATVEVMTHPLYCDMNGLSLDGVLCDTCNPLSNELAFWRSVEKFVSLVHYSRGV